jgi:hypothetical protein
LFGFGWKWDGEWREGYLIESFLGVYLRFIKKLPLFFSPFNPSLFQICEEEFAKWYISSEERILSKVKPIFDQFDANKSGTIDRDEVRQLLRQIEPRVTEKDVDEALDAMYKSGSKDEITYEEFADWYVHSLIYTRQQKEAEKQIEEESHGVCEALKPPRGEGVVAWMCEDQDLANGATYHSSYPLCGSEYFRSSW